MCLYGYAQLKEAAANMIFFACRVVLKNCETDQEDLFCFYFCPCVCLSVFSFLPFLICYMMYFLPFLSEEKKRVRYMFLR